MKKLIALMKSGVVMAVMAAVVSVAQAGETTQDVLVLATDQTVTVNAGDTLTVKRVTANGGAWTLTKDGAGTLVINDCEDETVKIVVSEGRLEVRSRAMPAVFSEAFFHVDASLSPSYIMGEEKDGVRYAWRWVDPQRSANRWATADGDNKPFLRNDFLNGRAVMDFGSLNNRSGDQGLAGYGASMTWSGTCKHTVDVFAVIGDTEDAKETVGKGWSGACGRPNTFFGSKESWTIGPRGDNPALALLGTEGSLYNWKSAAAVDGQSVVPTAYAVPDGMHLVNLTVTNASYLANQNATIELNAFARERNVCHGGIRIGEYIVFEKKLTDEQRADVEDYFQSRWFRAFKVDEITVQAGAELAMPDAGRITANTYNRLGSFSGTGDVVAQTVVGKTTSIASLTLSSDVTYDVAEGDTLVVDLVGGYDYQIVKTGKGKLVIRGCSGIKPRVDVREGTLELGAEAADYDAAILETALAKAWFHVDASVASSMTTATEGDRTLVSTWKDVRGAGHPYASVNTPIGNHKPYLVQDLSRNLPVMDFGSLYNKSGDMGLAGYGAAMVWSEACTHPVEIFAVIGDTEDAKDTTGKGWTGSSGRPNSFFGSTVWNNGYRGVSPAMALFEPGNTYCNWGSEVVVDGQTVVPTSYAVPDGLHVVGLRITHAGYIGNPSAEIHLNSFARDYVPIYGGIRIGEYIVFNQQLSPDERATIRNYLSRKWKSDCNFAKVTAAKGTEIRVARDAKAVVDVVENYGATIAAGIVCKATLGDEIVVAEDVTDDPLRDASAWFHVDASADTLLLSENEVVCWSDVRGRKAASTSDRPSDGGVYAWYQGDKPFVNTSYLDNGLPVIDFGPIWREGLTVPKRAMRWSPQCQSPYHIFVVVADNETAKNAEGVGWNTKVDQPFIGNSYDCRQYPIIGRGPRSAVGQPSTCCFSDDSSGFGGYWNYGKGSMRIDGSQVNPAMAFPAGLHLVSVDMAASAVENGVCLCDAFAEDRGNLYGGQRLGEVLVCNQRMTESEKAKIDALLMAKWKGGPGAVRDAEKVTVAADKTLTLKYQQLAISDRMELDGTIVAKSVTAPATIAVNSADATVDGALVVPATGTLVLGEAWKRGRGKQKILGASSVSVAGAAAAQWTATLPAGSRLAGAKVTVEADGIYAEFVPRGLFIVVE